jgi:hypothetical protein
MSENNENGRFASDWVEVYIDEPGDHTVRPIPPGPRLEQAKALRDLILAEEARKKKARQDNAGN